jgi:hypothetical protein
MTLENTEPIQILEASVPLDRITSVNVYFFRDLSHLK